MPDDEVKSSKSLALVRSGRPLYAEMATITFAERVDTHTNEKYPVAILSKGKISYVIRKDDVTYAAAMNICKAVQALEKYIL